MRTSLSSLCGEFIKNRDVIKATFAWESAYIHPVAAAVFTDSRRIAEPERLALCRDILKENTGVFSTFRNYIRLPMIAMMAVSSDPNRKIQQALDAYGMLKKHFFSSSYLPLAAMTISDFVAEPHYEEVAQRTRKIYELMRDEHPMLTSAEDSVFAAMLALSEKSNEQIVADAEQCYSILKPQFFSGNAVQSLGYVLALCEGDPQTKCARTMELFGALKEKGYKYGTGYELATLGILAMLPADISQTADDVAAAADFLASQKGYGFFGVGKAQRLMHAGMIVASDCLDKSGTMQAAALSSTISLIIAQQAAICAAVAASNAANSAN